MSKICLFIFYFILKAGVFAFSVNVFKRQKDPFRITKPPFSAPSCQIILNKVGPDNLRNKFVAKGTLL